VLASIALEFTRGTRARQALTGGGWGTAFFELIGRNRRRYGGYVVHAAIVLLAIGVAGSSAYQTVREQKLRPGASMQAAGYTFQYLGTRQHRGPNDVELRAGVDVSRGSKHLATLQPGKNRYVAEDEVSNEVAIKSNWLTGEDVYLIADQMNTDGSLYLKVLVKPLVNLIWLAGVVFLFGSVIALWPDAREQRRLAERYALGGRSAVARA